MSRVKVSLNPWIKRLVQTGVLAGGGLAAWQATRAFPTLAPSLGHLGSNLAEQGRDTLQYQMSPEFGSTRLREDYMSRQLPRERDMRETAQDVMWAPAQTRMGNTASGQGIGVPPNTNFTRGRIRESSAALPLGYGAIASEILRG